MTQHNSEAELFGIEKVKHRTDLAATAQDMKDLKIDPYEGTEANSVQICMATRKRICHDPLKLSAPWKPVDGSSVPNLFSQRTKM